MEWFAWGVIDYSGSQLGIPSGKALPGAGNIPLFTQQTFALSTGNNDMERQTEGG